MDHEYLVDAVKLAEYLNLHCMGRKLTVKEDIIELLYQAYASPRKKFDKMVKDEVLLRIPRTKALELVKILDPEIRIQPLQLLQSLAPTSPELQSVSLLPRDAQRGEIGVITESYENLIDPERFPIASQYVLIKVDKVRFYMENDAGPTLREGEYVRIEVPSGLHGAVILPVDQDTGEVLLVTQYRHSAQEFLTEAPRGFGHIGDKDASVTAKRELLEETGHTVAMNKFGVEELYYLKSTFTDTGKLWERPSYYLAMVNKGRYSESFHTLNPAMEDPCWVGLESFIRALFAPNAIALAEDEYEFLGAPATHLEAMRPETQIACARLSIVDGFTTQVGMLALPWLRRRFPQAYQQAWSKIIDS